LIAAEVGSRRRLLRVVPRTRSGAVLTVKRSISLRRRRAVVALASVAAAATASGVAATPSSAAPAAGNVAFMTRTTQWWNPPYTNIALDAQRYTSVILTGGSVALKNKLKAYNPNIKVYLYKNLPEAVQSWSTQADIYRAGGVDWLDTWNYHRDWFLKSTSGAYIVRHFSSTENDYLMDVGSYGYQQKFTSNVLNQVKRDGWDGVFLDDTLATMAWWGIPGGNPASIAKYPSNTAWQGAVKSFLTYMSGQFHASGKKVVFNTCCDGTFHHRKAWALIADGSMDEGYVNPTNGMTSALAYNSGAGWNDWHQYLNEIVDAESTARYLIGFEKGCASNVTRMRYGLATTLLAAKYWTSFDYSVNQCGQTTEYWTADYDNAQKLGAPTTSFYILSNGVYKRDFQHGSVLVNPSALGTAYKWATLSTTTATFTGSGLWNVKGVSLAPESGYVMYRNGG
jgi:hypothetical protein